MLTFGQWGHPIPGLGSYGRAEEKKPSCMRFTSKQALWPLMACQDLRALTQFWVASRPCRIKPARRIGGVGLLSRLCLMAPKGGLMGGLLESCKYPMLKSPFPTCTLEDSTTWKELHRHESHKNTQSNPPQCHILRNSSHIKATMSLRRKSDRFTKFFTFQLHEDSEM